MDPVNSSSLPATDLDKLMAQLCQTTKTLNEQTQALLALYTQVKETKDQVVKVDQKVEDLKTVQEEQAKEINLLQTQVQAQASDKKAPKKKKHTKNFLKRLASKRIKVRPVASRRLPPSPVKEKARPANSAPVSNTLVSTSLRSNSTSRPEKCTVQPACSIGGLYDCTSHEDPADSSSYGDDGEYNPFPIAYDDDSPIDYGEERNSDYQEYGDQEVEEEDDSDRRASGDEDNSQEQDSNSSDQDNSGDESSGEDDEDGEEEDGEDEGGDEDGESDGGYDYDYNED